MTERRAAPDVTADEHKPVPRQTQGRWRIHCSCGWKGPTVALPGHGYGPWSEHFHAVNYDGPFTLEAMARG
jgi:hypothetical protein